MFSDVFTQTLEGGKKLASGLNIQPSCPLSCLVCSGRHLPSATFSLLEKLVGLDEGGASVKSVNEKQQNINTTVLPAVLPHECSHHNWTSHTSAG